MRYEIEEINSKWYVKDNQSKLKCNQYIYNGTEEECKQKLRDLQDEEKQMKLF